MSKKKKRKQKTPFSRAETEDKTGYNPAYSQQRGDVPKGGALEAEKIGRPSKRIPSGRMTELRDPQKINNPKVQGKARAKMLTDWKGGRNEYEAAVHDSALVNKFGPGRGRKQVGDLLRRKTKSNRNQFLNPKKSKR